MGDTAMNPNAREFLNFAAQSPTAFHAVAKLAELL